MTIKPGLVGEITHIVTEAETAATYGSGLVPTLSTPHLVALMENASRETVQAYLPESQSTVGTLINMRHLAPTPVGMEVRLRAEVLAVEGRRLKLHVEAWDEVEQIGVCEHERFIIDWERFMQRIAEKEKQLAN
ncbi:MAG: thioesterase family protein [Chloroflexota bacterium]|nr:thioesterase family protein [Chloroflexota bacterium]